MFLPAVLPEYLLRCCAGNIIGVVMGDVMRGGMSLDYGSSENHY